MPIYEFKCFDCDKITERIQSYENPFIPTCSCGGKTRKIPSLTYFYFPAAHGGPPTPRDKRVTNVKEFLDDPVDVPSNEDLKAFREIEETVG